MRKMILDSDFIRRRRQSLPMSVRALAKKVGVSGSMIERAEEGINHKDLPLSVVAALADALGCDVAQLFAVEAQRGEPRITDSDGAAVGADAATLGELLSHTQTLTSVDALAEALSWTSTRVDEGLKRLADRLPPCGLVLHRHNRDVSIRPTARSAEPAHLEATLRRHDAARGMNVREAQLLVRVIKGVSEQKLQGNADQVALGKLRNAGYVTRSTDLSPTEEVRFSLMLP